MKEIGLYIHIPYCKRKCFYCDFISFSGKEDTIKKYVEAIKKDISDCKYTGFNIGTIYIGGGTPSFIDPQYISEIIAKVREKFIVTQNAEITIEVNPGTVTREKLMDYKKAGINRLSIGLQSTDNDTLKRIGRIHSYEDFVETYDMAREIGFDNINVDLMLALPNQTLDDLKESVKTIANLKPEHISVYSLIVEENTKMEKMVQDGTAILPTDEEERAMYRFVKDYLEKHKYKHYEISNFAKPGFESKHNTDCWKQKEYIGVGAAACSFMDNKRYSNIESLEQYIKNIENGNPNRNLVLNETLNEEDKMNEFMMLGLRKIDGVNIGDFKKIFGVNPIMKYCKTLDKLTHEDLIQVDENSIKLSKKGIDLANLVWEEFV